MGEQLGRDSSLESSLKAYTEFAIAVKLDPNNHTALKGRQVPFPLSSSGL